MFNVDRVAMRGIVGSRQIWAFVWLYETDSARIEANRQPYIGSIQCRRAEDFWEGTRSHDVSQNITALLPIY
jgi:hypothetical protein